MAIDKRALETAIAEMDRLAEVLHTATNQGANLGTVLTSPFLDCVAKESEDKEDWKHLMEGALDILDDLDFAKKSLKRIREYADKMK